MHFRLRIGIWSDTSGNGTECDCSVIIAAGCICTVTAMAVGPVINRCIWCIEYATVGIGDSDSIRSCSEGYCKRLLQ